MSHQQPLRFFSTFFRFCGNTWHSFPKFPYSECEPENDQKMGLADRRIAPARLPGPLHRARRQKQERPAATTAKAFQSVPIAPAPCSAAMENRTTLLPLYFDERRRTKLHASP
jgi:hypothetical protein